MGMSTSSLSILFLWNKIVKFTSQQYLLIGTAYLFNGVFVPQYLPFWGDVAVFLSLLCRCRLQVWPDVSLSVLVWYIALIYLQRHIPTCHPNIPVQIRLADFMRVTWYMIDQSMATFYLMIQTCFLFLINYTILTCKQGITHLMNPPFRTR